MKNTIKISDEEMSIIKRAANVYGFAVRFDEQLAVWVVKETGFSWDSSCTVEEFFQEVKDYFKVKGLIASRDEWVDLSSRST